MGSSWLLCELRRNVSLYISISLVIYMFRIVINVIPEDMFASTLQ